MRWPGGTSLKASSRHTAAGRAALSDSETALPMYNSCIAAAHGGRILHKNGTSAVVWTLAEKKSMVCCVSWAGVFVFFNTNTNVDADANNSLDRVE